MNAPLWPGCRAAPSRVGWHSPVPDIVTVSCGVSCGGYPGCCLPVRFGTGPILL